MTCADWLRFRASFVAMRRTSWIDQRINDRVAMLFFLPWFGIALLPRHPHDALPCLRKPVSWITSTASSSAKCSMT
jgi:hypothetical protein